MSVYKDNATGKWRVIYRYTDITGKRKQTQKRGFETKREAVAWEHEMMLKSQVKLDMTFGNREKPQFHLLSKTESHETVNPQTVYFSFFGFLATNSCSPAGSFSS